MSNVQLDDNIPLQVQECRRHVYGFGGFRNETTGHCAQKGKGAMTSATALRCAVGRGSSAQLLSGNARTAAVTSSTVRLPAGTGEINHRERST